MSFAVPAGLWAALLAIPVVLAYALRRRSRERPVTALFLWEDRRSASGGRRWTKPTRRASLWLELLAVVLVTLTLAQPRCSVEGPLRRGVFVLDESLSMRAVQSGADAAMAAGEPVYVRVREAALARLEGLDLVTLVRAGARPELPLGVDAPISEARAFLREWRPVGDAAGPTAGLQLAASLGGQVILYSDGALMNSGEPGDGSPPPLEEGSLRALGQPTENHGFVGAYRELQAGVDRLEVQLVHFGASAVELPVRFIWQGGEERRRVALEPGEPRALAVRIPEGAGVVEVSLPPDALPDDDMLRLPPPRRRALPVALLPGLGARERAALERLLGAMDDVVRVEVGRDDEALGVADGAQPPDVTYRVGPPGSGADLELGPYGQKRRVGVGPFPTQLGHPLLEDVTLDGVLWASGEGAPGLPLVTGSDGRALVAVEGARLRMDVSLRESTLGRSPAWPLLLSNALEQARERLPGFASASVALGEPVTLRAPAEGCVVEKQGEAWAGRPAWLPSPVEGPLPGSGPVAFVPSAGAGRYALVCDGHLHDTVEVLPVAPAESDLRGRATLRVDAAGGGPRGPGGGSQDLWSTGTDSPDGRRGDGPEGRGHDGPDRRGHDGTAPDEGRAPSGRLVWPFLFGAVLVADLAWARRGDG